MFSKSFSLLFIVIAVACVANGQTSGNWTVVNQNFAKLAMGLNFSSPLDGIIAASDANGAAEFLQTSDGGSSFSPASFSDGGFYFAVRLSNNGASSNGVAAGLGLLGSPCAAVSNDGGNTWLTDSEKFVFCSSQSVAVADSDENTLVIAGQWASALSGSGDGVRVSSDGGKTFLTRSWTNDVNATARYVAAPSDTTFYVTGGSWPVDDEQQNERSVDQNTRRVSRSVSVHQDGRIEFDMPTAVETRVRGAAPVPTQGFVGVVASSNDAGKSWTTRIDLRDEGLYFNAVSCSSLQNCTAVAEGVDANGDAAVYAFSTTNGFATSNRVRLPVFSALAVSMIDSQYGWIAGIVPNSARRPQALFLRTLDGGNTWNQVGELINGFAPMDLQTLSHNDAVAVGSNSFGLPVIARFH